MNMKLNGQDRWKTILVALTAATLTACGGGGGGDTPPASSTPAPGTNTPAPGNTNPGTNPPNTGDTPTNPAPVAMQLSVSSVTPGDTTRGVALNSPLTVTFNVPVDPATVTSAFTVRESTSAQREVRGTVTVSADGRTATFTPLDNLEPNIQYAATVSNAVTSTEGSALAQDHTWSFVTTSALTVESTYPAETDAALPINSKIAVVFNQDIDATTITPTSFTVRQSGTGGAVVTGRVAYSAGSRMAVFTPDADLAPSTSYTATISTSVRTDEGTALTEETTWTFTTAAASDTDKPTATAFSPASDATNVALSSPITVTFSEKIDPSTILGNLYISNAAHVHVSPTKIVVNNTNNTVTIFHDGLTADTRYHIVVTERVRDLAGNLVDAGAAGEVQSFFQTGAQ